MEQFPYVWSDISEAIVRFLRKSALSTFVAFVGKNRLFEISVSFWAIHCYRVLANFKSDSSTTYCENARGCWRELGEKDWGCDWNRGQKQLEGEAASIGSNYAERKDSLRLPPASKWFLLLEWNTTQTFPFSLSTVTTPISAEKWGIYATTTTTTTTVNMCRRLQLVTKGVSVKMSS